MRRGCWRWRCFQWVRPVSPLLPLSSSTPASERRRHVGGESGGAETGRVGEPWRKDQLMSGVTRERDQNEDHDDHCSTSMKLRGTDGDGVGEREEEEGKRLEGATRVMFSCTVGRCMWDRREATRLDSNCSGLLLLPVCGQSGSSQWAARRWNSFVGWAKPLHPERGGAVSRAQWWLTVTGSAIEEPWGALLGIVRWRTVILMAREVRPSWKRGKSSESGWGEECLVWRGSQ